MDVHILNHDGNLMDAASVAAISALCHFRRPEVAIQGRDVTVVSVCVYTCIMFIQVFSL